MCIYIYIYVSHAHAYAREQAISLNEGSGQVPNLLSNRSHNLNGALRAIACVHVIDMCRFPSNLISINPTYHKISILWPPVFAASFIGILIDVL